MSQTFAGKMSLVQMWNYELKPHTVEMLSIAPLSLHGNVLAWSDFKGHASSTLIVRNTTGDFANGNCFKMVVVEYNSFVVGNFYPWQNCANYN